MMQKYILILTMFLAVILYSCFEDEGNYSYKDFNNISKITGIDKEYRIYKFEDTLKIIPEFAYNKGSNNDLYEYEWSLLHNLAKDTIVISNERNLSFVADANIPNGEVDIVLKATNTTNGVSTLHYTKVLVMNSYNYGTFIFYENGENSEITLIKTNGSIVNNIYNTVTGKELIGLPLTMVDIMQGRDLFLNIVTHGPNWGSVLDFNSLEYVRPMSDCIQGGDPNGLKIDELLVFDNNIFTIIEGKVFISNTLVMGITPYFSPDIPDIDDNIDFVGENMYAHSANDGKIYIIGSWGAMDIFEHNGEPFLMPGKCYCMEMEAGVMSRIYRILVKEGDDSATEYIFEKAYNMNTYKYEDKFVSKNSFSAPELLDEGVLFTSSRVERYIYIAKDNIIYRYNYDAIDKKPEVFYEFPEGQNISYLKMESEYSYADRAYKDLYMAVGTYEESNSGNGGSLYHFDRTAAITKSYENICGKIKSIVNKK